jgi:hypothetical protein
MTPDTIRRISQLRQEFYEQFVAKMSVPVHITKGNSHTSTLSRATWINDHNQLNYLWVYAHSAPDDLVPERPFILQLAINKGGDVDAITRYHKGHAGLNADFRFELTLLPEELLGFLPWIVRLVQPEIGCWPLTLPSPPYLLDFATTPRETFRSAQTHQATGQINRPLPLIELPAV